MPKKQACCKTEHATICQETLGRSKCKWYQDSPKSRKSGVKARFTCHECPRGQYAPSVDASCRACPAGFYAPIPADGDPERRSCDGHQRLARRLLRARLRSRHLPHRSGRMRRVPQRNVHRHAEGHGRRPVRPVWSSLHTDGKK